MTVPYFLRMALLCLAAFSVIYVAAAACVGLLARKAIRAAEGMPARDGARLLLALRLAPAALGLLFVAAWCLPSYLWLEQDSGPESITWLGLAMAGFGMAIWVSALARTARVILHTTRWPGECAGTVIALVGVLRPRVVVSGDVRRALAPEELRAALHHEEAHRLAHDNFKRLLILLTPGIAALEQGWATLAEWAADDRAAEGDAARALTLAGALVHVAQLGARNPALGLSISFAAQGQELEARVHRLLEGTTPRCPRLSRFTIAAGTVFALGGVIAMLQPAVFSAVHELLEVFTY